ncbi:MAG: hypothetical protein IT289_03215 [Oligoflexia bacterium]|nr:hypothetical protein [Oligoflexia bacterium]
MADIQWLALLNYSAKYGVSLSTLRRRIKNNSIRFKLESGKYFIADEAVEAEGGDHSQGTKSQQPLSSLILPTTSSSVSEGAVLSSAHRLVEELKAAYAKILQEKEEQIGLLKEEVVDLRMLVRILEDKAGLGAEKKSSPQATGDDVFFSQFQTKDI